MRVLVVGSSGFLGRLACRELADAGHAVEGWSRAPHAIDARSGSFTHRVVDVERSALPAARDFDGVLLLAARSVPAEHDDPLVERAGVASIERLVDAVERGSPRARVVFASSIHVHAPSASTLDEDSPVDPRSGYGRAKLAGERLVLASGLDARIARLSSHVGPGQPRGLFVPDLLARLASDPAHVQMTGPDARRDVGDGRDAATALVALLGLDGARGEVFHVASGRVTTLADLARRICRRLDRAVEVAFAPGTGPTRIASAAKLVARSDWRPARTLDETVEWIAEDPRARRA